MVRTDEAIKDDIDDHLAWDSRIDAHDIRVTVEDNRVTLAGTVSTYGERMAAYQGTWTVPGVLAVDNQLSVTPAEDYALPDDDAIWNTITQILHAHPSIDGLNIKVNVEDGEVQLSGTVDVYWKKQRINEIVGDVGGVIDIQNDISVQTRQSTPDDVVANVVEQALARNAQVDADRVSVSVKDGMVTLRGTVPNWATYREAYQSALYTVGVTGVIDALEVEASDA